MSEGTGRIDSSLKAFELKIKELELSGELSGKDVALVMEEMKRVERF